MELLASLQQRLGLAILLITHDLGVVAEFCERVIVMYTGRIVEEAPVDELFGNPAHPYTRGLLASLPSVTKSDGATRLPTIKGMVPSISNLPGGCKFNPRCPDVMEICYGLEPALMTVGEGHTARCYLHGDQPDPERMPT
jgi:oligopeptide/dipeptide ABC transporter ATP-binding protein